MILPFFIDGVEVTQEWVHYEFFSDQRSDPQLDNDYIDLSDMCGSLVEVLLSNALSQRPTYFKFRDFNFITLKNNLSIIKSLTLK